MLPDRIEAVLSDNGLAFMTAGHEAPEMPDTLAEDGRGLALAGQVLDALDYHRVDDANHWRLVRTLT